MTICACHVVANHSMLSRSRRSLTSSGGSAVRGKGLANGKLQLNLAQSHQAILL